MNNYKIIDFEIFGDERGCLTSIEASKNVPFPIKRVFYIYGTKGIDVVRGDHANRNSKFVLLMVSGSAKVKVFNNEGSVQEVINLDKPNKGLYLDNMIWKEMYDFSDNSVMLVLASEKFDPLEYIDTYEEFLKEVAVSN